MPDEIRIQALHHVGLDELKKHSNGYLLLGVLIVVLGTIALGASTLTTLASMVFVGSLMIFAGVAQTLYAFRFKSWGGSHVGLLSGILSMVVGFLIVAHPGATAMGLTLLIVMFLVFGGVFRIALAISQQFQNRMWVFINGAINLALGLMIWHDWPVSGLWVIGTFVGIDMIFNGWSLIMLASAAKSLPDA